MAQLGTDIGQARTFLTQGQLVGIPTETVYGLAANALDPQAVASIFATKNRPTFDPLILHVASLAQVAPFVIEIPEKLQRLAEKFWPGPLTLLLPKTAIVPDLVTSGLERVAVRVPNHPLTLTLLEQLDFPLAAPSANPFGYISPTQASHVAAQLGTQIPYILDGGACSVGLESTIVGIEAEELVVYRLGGLELKDIETVAGPVRLQAHSTSNPSAPGQLESHYSPRKPFVLGNLPQLVAQLTAEGKSFAVLSFSTFFPEVSQDKQFALSSTRNLKEAAQRLFMAMRALDDTDVALIVAEVLPEEGLGRAINDRLRRAAVQATD
jgi:L-threonylcarbamoyladenylate synthase